MFPYDTMDSTIDAEMGSRKIHTVAVLAADYAGAISPSQNFLVSSPLLCFPSLS
jgi:hypothetical protein